MGFQIFISTANVLVCMLAIVMCIAQLNTKLCHKRKFIRIHYTTILTMSFALTFQPLFWDIPHSIESLIISLLILYLLMHSKLRI